MMRRVELASRIDTVTVYRSGALVERVAELPGDPIARVRVAGLPVALDDGSVRVAIEGEAIATDVRVALDVPGAATDLAPAKPEELRAAEREVARMNEALARVRRRISRLAALAIPERPAGRSGREPPPSPGALRLDLADLRASTLAELDAEELRWSDEHRSAERRLADLRERDRIATSARRAEPHELRKAIEVALRGSGGALRVSYFVQAAKWAPLYTLRLANDASR